MVGLLVRIPCCLDIDLSGKLFCLHDFLGEHFCTRVRVQLGEPDIRRLRNYYDWIPRRESVRPDYWHVPDHQNRPLTAIDWHYLDVTERRHGSIGLGCVARYLHG